MFIVFNVLQVIFFLCMHDFTSTRIEEAQHYVI
jgi:hypothetical protein